MTGFNEKVASDIGVVPAAILDGIYTLVKESESRSENFYDGRYWIQCSKREMSEKYFPYLTECQVNHAVKTLLLYGYVVKAKKAPSSAYALWHTVTEKTVDAYRNE